MQALAVTGKIETVSGISCPGYGVRDHFWPRGAADINKADPVREFRTISFVALALALTAGVCTAPAQDSFYERMRSNNVQMKQVQPTWMGPLIQSDSRLGQGLKVSVSNSKFPPAQPTIYGNNKGVSVIVDRRFQLDFDPPSFFRNHSSSMKDGFGNAGTQVKWRLKSGNAEHGNFALTAIMYHGFEPRAYQNQMLSSYYVTSIAAGKGVGRLALLTTVGGFLPTAKIAAQGRAVEWNLTAQAHATEHLWFDVENNASFFHAGPDDGKVQNLMTPAAFYMVRRRDWKPEHAALVFDCGMQIATTSYHILNHNLVTEMRIMF